MPPNFGRKWGTECLNTRFPLPILLCAGYSVKLIFFSCNITKSLSGRCRVLAANILYTAWIKGRLWIDVEPIHFPPKYVSQISVVRRIFKNLWIFGKKNDSWRKLAIQPDCWVCARFFINTHVCIYKHVVSKYYKYLSNHRWSDDRVTSCINNLPYLSYHFYSPCYHVSRFEVRLLHAEWVFWNKNV